MATLKRRFSIYHRTMRQAPGSLQTAETELPAPELLLLIAPEPWSRIFLQNLRDLFRSSDRPAAILSPPRCFLA